MVTKLIGWALANPLLVVVLAFALAGFGGYAFFNVNVEAYPDPAPAIIEVVAQYPGASTEEVERLVTIPMEVALASMPGLKYTRSKSLFGLSYLNCQFEYGVDYLEARQESINRLGQAQSSLPPGVAPQISPRNPVGEFYRYILTNPEGDDGQHAYTLNDIKSVQDWTLEREFGRLPRIGGVVSFGGSTKRYEIRPDPDRLKQYGITLSQLQYAIANSNQNISGDLLPRGGAFMNIRGLGLIGQGRDPIQEVLGLKDPAEAGRRLRAEEERRLQEIRQIVLASTNNVPVRIEHVVQGESAESNLDPRNQGLAVSHQTRQGWVSLSRPVVDGQKRELLDKNGHRIWKDEEDVVQGLVELRKNEQSLPALEAVKAKVEELNNGKGRLLPGQKLDCFYDRTKLINLTTETVRENLLLGMSLVIVILLMFLSNIRTALIVAINIPLALLFAFGVLLVRKQSANLLSIGAVDFGIIVDSTVIMVENIYRHLKAGDDAGRPLVTRIIHACREVERSLFFSTLIMICALLPLLTMQGPEGRIFGPMADTYGFALAGALLLALTLSPVLCLFFLRGVKPARDNELVRWLRSGYLRQLERVLNHRVPALVIASILVVGTIAALPWLGREFMPELEEGGIWARGMYPVNISLEEVVEKSRQARRIMQQFPEIELVYCQIGRPDDGTDAVGFYSSEFCLPLKDPEEWPVPPGKTRPRTKPELIAELNEQLSGTLIGVDWCFTQPIRDMVFEVLSGVQGENSVKIFGPDLEELEKLGQQVKQTLAGVPGIKNPEFYSIMGQSNLELAVDRKKCALWNVAAADAENALQTAAGGKALTQMVEGERSFDITLRWPWRLRADEDHILDIPVDVTGHTVTPGSIPQAAPTPGTGGSTGVSPTGSSAALPALGGSIQNPVINSTTPRRRLRDLVTAPPAGPDGMNGDYTRPGASMIYREQGLRMATLKFEVRGRDLAGTVAEAQQKTAHLFKAPYRAVWSGEFEEMEKAERRLILVVSLSLLLILVLLYMAFRSILDVLAVLSNVLALSVGGVWALLLTGNNFNISAAVGFISIAGVAIMDGLLLISYFNQMRAQGLPLREAIIEGAAKRVRPVMMTALTAIFGLLPAAVATRIGSQSQRPLAIVVVGGMITTLFLTRYLMPLLYSFYGDRQPPAVGGGLTH